MISRKGMSRTDQTAEKTIPMRKRGGKNDDGKERYALQGASSLQDLRGDVENILLLLLLYTLQGVPMGLAASVPLLLQERGASYSQQSIFSLVSWPFSLKLLWAPIVDSCYDARVGRRRSWLIPAQLVCGVIMVFSSSAINFLIGADGKGSIAVSELTVCFFVLYLLMATQDIAVDGWALTILSRKNVGWASTCNSTGQTLGYILSFIIFMALNNKEFSNAYARRAMGYPPQEAGLITLGGFMAFWGWVFLATTLYVWLFKPEKSSAERIPASDDRGDYSLQNSGEGEQVEEEMGVKETYMAMWRVVKQPAVRRLGSVLLLSKVAFAAADAVTGLKLQEKGVKKETMALLGVAVTPIALFLPAAVSKYTSGPRPLAAFMRVFPYRLAINVAFAVILWSIPPRKGDEPVLSPLLWAVLLFFFLLQQVVSNVMFVAQMAFFAKVSDPKIGGTYMTLLNTVANLGSKWPTTIVLALVDVTTSSLVDGYYVLTSVCTLFGAFWFLASRLEVEKLDLLPSSAWFA
ncbi:hypothetical protein GUITHDRAFT_110438 [Guillardia theta CCMP2712]|uniref:Acetyl-CoA transporter n=1 Tax=Guillardia theta (strain CCMP2712) TaxID=905079 RepID=L1J5L9_GUITC|nr:hypothetical protein GUITHDRAFT_110438 [Guillardia theta CCMP2712]EKX43642.1 hypothetical protein GUITHDRAFT_110438 [Guillardia theta CCMP2712]|eukprot:XP_005830622.1 hypothetical protein GUITHDRAFT_110438 [Guillardia theta CCMP2712]